MKLSDEELRLKELIGKLNKVGVALTIEKDTDKLLDLILQESIDITYSDGGSIYIKDKNDEQQDVLVFKKSSNRSVEFDFKGGILAIDNASIAGYVALTGNVLNLNDINNIPEEHKVKYNNSFDLKLNYKTVNMIIVPMKTSGGEIIGVLQLINKNKYYSVKPEDTEDFQIYTDYTDEDKEILLSLASQTAILIEKIKLNEKLEKNITQTRAAMINLFNNMKQAMGFLGEDIMAEQEEFKKLATIDELTKLLMRREGFAYIEKQLQLAKFNGYHVVICFIDVNGLKEVNDRYGHQLGDELLVSVSNILKDVARSTDTVIRYGGDEFLLVLYKTKLGAAKFVWDRVVEKFEEINNAQLKPYSLSASHGFAEYIPNEGKSLEELIKVADSEMYKEKKIYKLSKKD